MDMFATGRWKPIDLKRPIILTSDRPIRVPSLDEAAAAFEALPPDVRAADAVTHHRFPSPVPDSGGIKIPVNPQGMAGNSHDLYVWTRDGLLMRLDTSDGTTRWRVFDASPPGTWSHAATENDLYCSDDDQLWARPATPDTTGWTSLGPLPGKGGVCAAGDALYLAEGEDRTLWTRTAGRFPHEWHRAGRLGSDVRYFMAMGNAMFINRVADPFVWLTRPASADDRPWQPLARTEVPPPFAVWRNELIVYKTDQSEDQRIFARPLEDGAAGEWRVFGRWDDEVAKR
jgi:hypothetical protein